jgi:hypothetical protein
MFFPKPVLKHLNSLTGARDRTWRHLRRNVGAACLALLHSLIVSRFHFSTVKETSAMPVALINFAAAAPSRPVTALALNCHHYFLACMQKHRKEKYPADRVLRIIPP